MRRTSNVRIRNLANSNEKVKFDFLVRVVRVVRVAQVVQVAQKAIAGDTCGSRTSRKMNHAWTLGFRRGGAPCRLRGDAAPERHDGRTVVRHAAADVRRGGGELWRRRPVRVFG